MSTHSELFHAAYAAGLTKKQRLHVQYRKQGIGICAELVELFEIRGEEWAKLWSHLDGYISRPCSVIRVCEGDMQFSCSCATSTQCDFSRAGVVAPHESLNIETQGE